MNLWKGDDFLSRQFGIVLATVSVFLSSCLEKPQFYFLAAGLSCWKNHLTIMAPTGIHWSQTKTSSDVVWLQVEGFFCWTMLMEGMILWDIQFTSSKYPREKKTQNSRRVSLLLIVHQSSLSTPWKAMIISAIILHLKPWGCWDGPDGYMLELQWYFGWVVTQLVWPCKSTTYV